MSKRCYGCMRIKENSPVCEHCGYHEKSENAESQLPVGTVLGQQYVIGRVLGQGGFGITYLGWDNALQMAVAIKEFYPSHLVNREPGTSFRVITAGGKEEELFRRLRERFLREAQTLAKLSHIDGVVHIHRLFEQNNTAYIVMEYIQGVDLRSYQRMQDRPMTPAETFLILDPVMYALSKVHEAGLVHRDVSPDNIMLQSNGRVKLLDFGSAKEVEQAAVNKNLPQSTQAILKHGFAAVEQYQRRGSLGPWTDVYGLCATMYFCMTGKIPSSVPDRISGHDEVNWNNIPGLTREQISVLEKGLALLPENRIRSTALLWRGLRETEDKTELRYQDTNRDDTILVRQKPVRPQPSVQHKQEPQLQPQQSQPKPQPIQQREPEQSQMQPQPEKTVPKPEKRGVKAVVLMAAAVLAVAVTVGFLLRKPQIEEEPQIVQSAAGFTLPEDAAFPVHTDGQEEEPLIPATMETGLLIPQSWSWENNVLMRKPDKQFSGISKQDISQVTFLNSKAEAPEDCWDVSKAQDQSVVAWARKDGSNYHVYIAGDGGVNGAGACRELFASWKNLEQIRFDGNFHTDYETDMYEMFRHCEKLKILDLEGLHTGAVTNMGSMFADCVRLETLNLQGLDTSAVINMSHMFGDCRELRQIDLSGFDTSAVTDMSGMFSDCKALTVLRLGGFDTSAVVDMSYMFCWCRSLPELDVSSFRTAKVTNMSQMFAHCEMLETLDLSKFDFSNVSDMNNMFSFCSQLHSLNLGTFRTLPYANKDNMYYECHNLPKEQKR